MKIFVLVIVAATIIGGLIGGELTDQSFTIWGAALGGVGTFAVLMGLGAYFYHQEEKKRKSVNLTPEMRAVFGRMLGVQPGTNFQSKSASQRKAPPPDLRSVEATVRDLIEQDRRDFAAGIVNERRLIPHHAIKRDIILMAFEKDFSKLSPSMQDLNKDHFQSQIADIKQWDQHQLDRMIATMKTERTDLRALEEQVRKEKPFYSIVDPLFS